MPYFGTGQITESATDYIVIDDEFKCPIDLIENNTGRINHGDAIEYDAVKCRNRSHPFRCIRAKLLAREEKKKIFPTVNEIIGPIEKATDNLGGITIPKEEVLFTISEPGQSQEMSIVIKNITKANSHQLISMELESATHFEIVSPNFEDGPLVILPSTRHTITLRATSTEVGIYPGTIIYDFNGFQIIRSLKLVCGDEAYIEKYTKEYRPQAEVPKEQMLENINRMRLRKPPNIKARVSSIASRLPQKPWPIPPLIRELLLEDDWAARLSVKTPFLFDHLDAANYKEKMNISLFVVELELFKEFQKLSQTGVILDKHETTYSLPCKDVAETRPSVIVGDRVFCENKNKRLEIQGRIVEVQANSVIVLMDQEFDAHSLLPFDVSFEFSRTHFKIQHTTVEFLVREMRFESLMFPKELQQVTPLLHIELEPSGRLTMLDDVSGSRRLLTLTRNDLDASQRKVIRNVLRGEYRSVPYLIRGPPGTGKTTTLTEIIVQLATHNPESKILVSTQSNSAANLILSKLIETRRFTKKDFVRVVGAHVYTQDTVPAELKPYCATFSSPKEEVKNDELEGIRTGLDLLGLVSYQIVIVTCGSVGRFHDMRLSAEHFTHLLLDEAGQCLETEAVMTISLLVRPDSQIVLVGDDKQLGPVVMCPALRDTHFDLSLFERIMAMPFYNAASEEHNEVVSNTLNYNYRSLPSILNVFNSMFYNHELKAMVSWLSGECFGNY